MLENVEQSWRTYKVILDNGCSSMILTRKLVEKLDPKIDAVMQWQMQAGNITTNFKVKIDFTLPTLSATNVVTWKCHVYESARGRYDMILGRYLWKELGLNLKFPNTSLKDMMDLLKGIQYPRLIWVRTYP